MSSPLQASLTTHEIDLHHFDLPCGTCHQAPVNTDDSTSADWAKAVDVNRACTLSGCHEYDEKMNHPVDVPLPIGVFNGTSKTTGTVTYLSCHAPELLAGSDNQTDQLLQQPDQVGCDSCHTQLSGSFSQQSHWKFSQKAHLVSLVPNPTNDKFSGDRMGTDIDAESSTCLSCHDEVSASTRDVTNTADWSVEPEGIASITAGLLTTGNVNLPGEVVTVTAQYSQGDNIQAAQKDVEILTICPGGSALGFDGVDDSVDCGGSGSLNVTELTWALWIKRGEDTYSNERALISNTAAQTDPAEAEGTYALQIDAGGQYQDRIQFVRHGLPVAQCPLSNTIINDENWHHVAVTRSANGDVIIYIDGCEDAAGYLPERTAYRHTVIGAGHINYSNFKGSIDEVVIYSRPLSGGEIQTLMHTRPDTSDPALEGYWNFDEGQGPVAADSSAYGNNGTLRSVSDPDSSAPIWIASDAPVGICAFEGIVERNLTGVMNSKLSILGQLYETMAQEQALWDYMDAAFKNRDIGGTGKGDVVRAKQKIMGALQHEQQARTAMGQSINRIGDAMNSLGLE